MSPPRLGTRTHVRVDLPEQAADRRLRRAPPINPERQGVLSGQVSDPLADRDERARSGRDRAHRHGQHPHQAMADPAPLARIDHVGQDLTQVGSQYDRIG